MRLHNGTFFIYFTILSPKVAERRLFMSAIIHVMGRLTKDPVMQQGKNNGSEYISLDLAASQRSQDAQQKETIFYQCFFNKFLAERLLKANVKAKDCIYVYGDLELHPYIYQKGQRAGQAGISAKINVKDWQFCLANKPDSENQKPSAQAPNGAVVPNTGMAQTVSGNVYQNSGIPQGYRQGAAVPMQTTPVAGGETMYPTSPMPPSGANAYQQNYQSPAGMTYGQPGTYNGDGFQSIPEGMANQLPYSG